MALSGPVQPHAPGSVFLTLTVCVPLALLPHLTAPLLSARWMRVCLNQYYLLPSISVRRSLPFRSFVLFYNTTTPIPYPSLPLPIPRACSYPLAYSTSTFSLGHSRAAMSAPEPMAVVAPNLGSSASTLASRAPEVVNGGPRGRPDDSDDEEMPLARKANGAKPNGGGGGGTAKRVVESSSEDEKPLSKKPRVSANKRRIVDSEDEESEAGPSSSPAVPVKKEAPPTVSRCHWLVTR